MDKLYKYVISLCLLLGSGVALAQAFGGGGGGLTAAAANSLYCQLTGGTGCTMSASPGTADIQSTNNTDLLLSGQGTGSVQLMSGDGTIDLIDNAGTVRGGLTPQTNGLVRFSATVSANLGSSAARTATQVSASLVDSSTTNLFDVYGSGAVKKTIEQSITCAAGVAALDPQSSHISIDPAGAACAVTIAETSAATIGPGFEATIYIATSAGAGTVTFPDVANVFDAPTLCSTTGLPINGTMTIFYANKTDDMFVTTGCSTP